MAYSFQIFWIVVSVLHKLEKTSVSLLESKFYADLVDKFQSSTDFSWQLKEIITGCK